MKIALAQINPTVGDVAANAELIRRDIVAARDAGARLVVFPELCIIGYPPRDLLLKPSVIERCLEAVGELAGLCTDVAAIIGYPCPADRTTGRSLYNAAAFCRDGRIVQRNVKSLLPTYDVFDEHRYFEPATDAQAHEPVELDGLRLGISICEDLWNDRELIPRPLYHGDPIQHLAQAGAQVLVNIAASPFVVGKNDFRLKLAASAARRHGMPVVYCNQVGGNDELVFDGNSCVVDVDGRVIAQARDFEPDLLLVDLPDAPAGHRPAPLANRVESPRQDIASVYHALVLGLRDYCGKCRFKSVVVGLSGGIDSAVTAALCVAALGPKQVRGVAMPSRYSSTGSVEDARALAANLDIRLDTVPIEPAHAAFEHMLKPLFEGTAAGVAEENVQARVRGVVLMAMSNKFGSLLVTTGNKSEIAVGYCTLYGDMAGGLAVLSDVPKTMVWDLARWINDDADSPLRRQFAKAVIPQSSITKPPSAELRENQTDQDTLPPYEQLDQIIERYVEREQSARQIAADTGIDATIVLRTTEMIDRNEYKRKQMAPGLKVTGRAFGIGRRMPIAQRWDNRRDLESIFVR